MSKTLSSLPGASPTDPRATRLIEYCFLSACVILIPFDIPVVHQACIPLTVLAVVLMVLRRDMYQFLQFMREQRLILLLISLIWVVSLISIFANFITIMSNQFQQQAGWVRAVSQALLLLVTMIFPQYFGFCLWRREGWGTLVANAAWWSLPIPLLVGFLQIANLFHIPGLTRLPYIGAPYEEGSFWRLTSVARESSWFGSFACVILPFLVLEIARLTGWKRLSGIACIGIVLLFVILGTSKSAYAAVAVEAITGMTIYVISRRPWRMLGKAVFGIGVILVALFATSMLAPAVFIRLIAPFANKAEAIYNIFAPLVMGNTKAVSIGTRFGMSSAGIAMGQAYPLFGVGLGQFGYHAYNFTPLWGWNGETLNWLSNDKNAWPSTSNLYARLVGEVGFSACALYCALRLALLLLIGIRLLHKQSATWARDLCVLAGMTALIAFDFHRDSFINLDAWVLLGMAIASIQPDRRGEWRVASATPGISNMRLFLASSIASFVIALMIVLFTPVTYLASATLAPKDNAIVISSEQAANGSALSVIPSFGGFDRFRELRMYWASTTVAASMIADHPGLVRAVLGSRPVEIGALTSYIKDNVTVLLADKQTTMTLQYRNADAMVAKEFLSATIEETDRMVMEATKRPALQAGQLLRIALASNLDYPARQNLLNQVAAQDLQSDFNIAGANASFDYIEHPGISRQLQSPNPVIALLFALSVALLVGATTTGLYLLWLGNRLPVATPADLSVQ